MHYLFNLSMDMFCVSNLMIANAHFSTCVKNLRIINILSLIWTFVNCVKNAWKIHSYDTKSKIVVITSVSSCINRSGIVSVVILCDAAESNTFLSPIIIGCLEVKVVFPTDSSVTRWKTTCTWAKFECRVT